MSDYPRVHLERRAFSCRGLSVVGYRVLLVLYRVGSAMTLTRHRAALLGSVVVVVVVVILQRPRSITLEACLVSARPRARRRNMFEGMARLRWYPRYTFVLFSLNLPSANSSSGKSSRREFSLGSPERCPVRISLIH